MLFTTAEIRRGRRRYVHTAEHYAAKKNEILPFATTRLDLEGVMRSEISRAEKDKCHVVSLIGESEEQNKRTDKAETGSWIKRTD